MQSQKVSITKRLVFWRSCQLKSWSTRSTLVPPNELYRQTVNSSKMEKFYSWQNQQTTHTELSKKETRRFRRIFKTLIPLRAN